MRSLVVAFVLCSPVLLCLGCGRELSDMELMELKEQHKHSAGPTDGIVGIWERNVYYSARMPDRGDPTSMSRYIHKREIGAPADFFATWYFTPGGKLFMTSSETYLEDEFEDIDAELSLNLEPKKEGQTSRWTVTTGREVNYVLLKVDPKQRTAILKLSGVPEEFSEWRIAFSEDYERLQFVDSGNGFLYSGPLDKKRYDRVVARTPAP